MENTNKAHQDSWRDEFENDFWKAEGNTFFPTEWAKGKVMTFISELLRKERQHFFAVKKAYEKIQMEIIHDLTLDRKEIAKEIIKEIEGMRVKLPEEKEFRSFEEYETNYQMAFIGNLAKTEVIDRIKYISKHK